MEDIGETIEKVRVGHDGSGFGAGWHLDKLEVRRLHTSGKVNYLNLLSWTQELSITLLRGLFLDIFIYLVFSINFSSIFISLLPTKYCYGSGLLTSLFFKLKSSVKTKLLLYPSYIFHTACCLF